MKIFSYFISLTKKTIVISGFILISACNTGSEDSLNYQIVVDSGSTGSRAIVFRIDQSTQLPAITNLFEVKNNIPLASFASNPENAGSSAIQPLLSSVESFLNANGIASDQILTSVLGTAGMRTIPVSSQAAIYQSVVNSIRAENLRPGTVATISGQDEGLYAWLNSNYLQNNFDNTRRTKGIIEVGGASAQIAFESTRDAPQTKLIRLNGNNYYVYSVDFQGLGQDQARLQMNATPNHNQCYPSGYNTGAIIGNFNFNGCANNYFEVTSGPDYSGLSTINTIPGFYNQQFVGVGSVFFALDFWNITTQPDQALLEQHINTTCYQNYADLTVQYPKAFQLYNQCANAIYINGLLYDDLALGSDQLIALNNINGISLNYALGYVLLGYTSFNTIN